MYERSTLVFQEFDYVFCMIFLLAMIYDLIQSVGGFTVVLKFCLGLLIEQKYVVSSSLLYAGSCWLYCCLSLALTEAAQDNSHCFLQLLW
jgi:hypothetical protein